MSVNVGAMGSATLAPDLSLSEKNCLQMIAEGRSLFEISAILTLPEQDVQELLETAEDKLGAKNRLHAVSVAMRRGHIDF